MFYRAVRSKNKISECVIGRGFVFLCSITVYTCNQMFSAVNYTDNVHYFSTRYGGKYLLVFFTFQSACFDVMWFDVMWNEISWAVMSLLVCGNQLSLSIILPSQHPSKPQRNESQGNSDKTDRKKRIEGGNGKLIRWYNLWGEKDNIHLWI